MSTPDIGTAVVTGSSSGIGMAVAQLFLQKGWRVYGLDKSPSDWPSISDAYHHITIDLERSKDLHGLLDDILFSDHVNALVNCAGVREITSIDDLSLDVWESVNRINVTAPFILSCEFSRLIRGRSSFSSIVNIASVSGLLGEPNRTAYVTSKHALIGLTKQLAIEYGRFGINVNSISPGVIRTPLTESYYFDPEQLQRIRSGQFIDRGGCPNDVARLVEFLTSPHSDFITGANYVIDGGWTAGKNI